jgi:hypothetical protein
MSSNIMDSSNVLARVAHLKSKLGRETTPCRQKVLQRHIDLLLDRENQRLTDLIEATLQRIQVKLNAFDAQFHKTKKES